MEQYNYFSCTKFNTSNCSNCQFKQFKQFKYHDSHGHYQNQKKAGIIYFNKSLNKILIVQSRGSLWGIPKGTCKFNESLQQCAIRELYEETDISVSEDDIKNCKTVVIGTCTYYCLESVIEYE